MSAVMRVLRRITMKDVKVRCLVRDAYTHMLQITVQNEFVFTLPLK